MTDDPQDIAEQLDEDLVGADESADGNAVTSDEAHVDVPPERPLGIPFADADVTDESFADRLAQEEPEVWEASATADDGELAYVEGEGADERLEQIVVLPDDSGG